MKLSRVNYLFTVCILALTACKKNDEYKTSENGMEYRIVHDEKKPKAEEGQIIQYHIYWRTLDDSLFLNTRDKNLPLYSKVDSPKFKGDPLEILSLIGPGDSASCKVPADLVFRGAPPKFLHHGDFMKLDFKVISVMPESEYKKMTADRQSKQINEFIAKNNLNPEQTPSGLYVVITEPGTGAQAKNGDLVKVNYTGRLLDGTQFDSSLQPGREPFQFTIGRGEVIRGWDEGLTHFKAGGKGKLIIPSELGYGERGSPPSIPGNSPLEFDIELLEIQPGAQP